MVSVQIYDVAGRRALPADTSCVECAGYSGKCRLRVLPDDACLALDGRTLCVGCFVAEAAARNTDPERSGVLRRLWEAVV